MNESQRHKAYYCPSCRCAVGERDPFCASCETGKPPLGWPEDIYIGRVIGKKYRLDLRISSGGFGIIFLATHLHQDVEIGKVIIKMLHPEHSFEPVIKKRFINEARAARTIQSPHVVKIFDLDFDKGMVPYMVQEYVEGETLSGLLEGLKKLEVPRAVNIAIQVAEGMKEAHQKGILHRDLKPDNIIIQNVGGSEFVKIIDFGIARLERQSTLATASFIGTPRYMSPEQIQSRELDKRSDIFSLGVIIFEMVTGEPPIPIEGTEIEYLTLNVQKQPRKIIDFEPGIPEPLSMLVDSMLRKDPRERPADFEAVIAQLSSLAESLGWKADHTGSYKTAPLPSEDRTEPDARPSPFEKTTQKLDHERPSLAPTLATAPGPFPAPTRPPSSAPAPAPSPPSSPASSPASSPSPAPPEGRSVALAAFAAGIVAAAILGVLLWIFVFSPGARQSGPASAPAADASEAPPATDGAAASDAAADAAAGQPEATQLDAPPGEAETPPAPEEEGKPSPPGGEREKKKPGKKKKKEPWTKI